MNLNVRWHEIVGAGVALLLMTAISYDSYRRTLAAAPSVDVLAAVEGIVAVALIVLAYALLTGRLGELLIYVVNR